MRSDLIRIGLVAAAAAIIATAAFEPGGAARLRFALGNYNREAEDTAVRKSLELFSATVAGFYASGGVTEGLNILPADNLVKRRIFHDINLARRAGLVKVFDRDRSEVRSVLFPARDFAISLVDEDWFVAYQDAETRRKVSMNKRNAITVRYYLQKQWGRWIVLDYEVFGEGDAIPPSPEDWYAQR